MATSKAFIGPPEVRGRGLSGLSEDITDQALTGPSDDDAVDKAVLIGIHNAQDVKQAIDKNSGDGLRSDKRSRRDVVDTEAVIMRKLFVRNLNSKVTEEKIRDYFSEFGEIEIVHLPAHSDSGKIKGFAFVTFKESSSVDAVQMARPHRLAGTQVETTRARSRDRDFRGQAPYFGAVSSSGGYSGYGGQGQGGYSGFSGYSSLGQTWSSVQGGAAQGGGGPLRRHQRDTRGANPYDPYNRQ